MALTDSYIHEVTRRLPENMRTDIALELRSTIDDMLPDNFSEEDEKGVLNQLGNPVILANGYADRPMHLIGPRYYDVYVTLLKMIVPIAAAISLLSIVTKYIISYKPNEAILSFILGIVGSGFVTMLEVGMAVFFWLTLIFAVAERINKDSDQQPLTFNLTKWTADDLKHIVPIPKKKEISKLSVFANLMWIAIFTTLYFYANQIVGIYMTIADRLTFVMPAINQEVLQFYGPFVIFVIVLAVIFEIYKLLKHQWTKRMAVMNLLLQTVSTVLSIVIIKNANFLNPEFITFISEQFNLTNWQFNTWIIGGVMLTIILSAILGVYDGFKKAMARL